MKRIIFYSVVAVIIMCLFPDMLKAALPAAPVSGLTSIPSAAFNYSPDDSIEKVYDERIQRAHAPFIRVGFAAPSMISMMDTDLNYYYNRSWSLMADCFFFRKRNRLGNGLDIGARFTYRNFAIGEDIQKKASDLLYNDNRLHLMSWDVSFRAVIGASLARMMWQVYVIGAPRLLHYHAVMKDNKLGDPDKRINLFSIGIIGGAGLEVAPLPMLGIFAEYNIGYVPVGKSHNNVEGHQVYVGMTWRTLGTIRPVWW
ncbi:MAG: hypothetical protein A2176_11945 [Spirochaetes bacterium RBG_13_51_14]|nr:MAG: hypothetical protein A2176_11945 [Spirochaetes bacterium RBG_13_51_14]